jgi:hypothetical protein
VTAGTVSLAELAYIAAAIVAIGGGTLGLYRGARKLYGRTLGSRREEARKLNQLACGTPADYEDSLFGPPPFRFTGPSDKTAQTPGVTLLSRQIYRLRHALLMVTAGFDGSVRAFYNCHRPEVPVPPGAPFERPARYPPGHDAVRRPRSSSRRLAVTDGCPQVRLRREPLVRQSRQLPGLRARLQRSGHRSLRAAAADHRARAERPRFLRRQAVCRDGFAADMGPAA